MDYCIPITLIVSRSPPMGRKNWQNLRINILFGNIGDVHLEGKKMDFPRVPSCAKPDGTGFCALK